MKFISKGKNVPKKNEDKVIKLIYEIELIKKKLRRINQMVPIVKKNKFGTKRIKSKTARKSRKKSKIKKRKTTNRKRRKKKITKRRKK